MAVVILAIMGGVLFKRVKKYFYTGLLLLAILVACGVYSPVYRIMFKFIPGMNRFRSPATAMFLIAFCASVLAAFCVHALLTRFGKGNSRIKEKRFILAFFIIFTALLVMTFIVHRYYIRVCGKFQEYQTTGGDPAFFYSRLHLIVISLRRSVFFASVTFGSLGFILLCDYLKREGKIPGYALIIPRALFLLLFLFDAGMNDRAFIQAEPVQQFERYLFQSWPNELLRSQPQPVSVLEKNNELSNRYLLSDIGVPLGYHPIELRHYIDAWNAAKPGSLGAARLSACAFIVAPLNKRTDKNLVLVDKNIRHKKALYRWKDPVPYAYVPETMEFFPEQGALLEKMSSRGFDPHISSYMMSENRKNWKRSYPAQSYNISVQKYGINSVLLSSDLPEECYVVTGDVWMPGWKALLDGKKPVPVLRANNAFRAVFLPSGKHEIRLYYRPDSFTYGAIISLISLALWLGLLFYLSRIHKERKR